MLLFNHGFYDVLGNPESVVHSDGQAVYYGYDTVGNRTGVRTEVHGTVQTYVTYEHDQLNRVTDVHDHDASRVPVDPDTWLTDAGAATTQLGYNPLGQLTTITRPNDVTTTYSYGNPDTVINQGIDFEGQIYSHNQNPYQVYEINHNHSTNGLISEYDYTYDSVGNRTQMVTTASDLSTTTANYEYDDAYRLEVESYPLSNATISTTYQYDRAGNRTVATNRTNDTVTGETRYSYNNNDELERIDFVGEFMYQKYEYDARGNLTEITSWNDGVTDIQIGSATTLAYNARDHLVSYGVGGSPLVIYDYDHQGNRIGGTESGVTTDYLWDEFSQYGDVLLATNPSDTTGYTLADGMLVSQTINGTTDYFLQDVQNSTVALADTTGVVTSTYSYDAFGNLDEDILDTDIETDYLYTGQFFDYENTELYNLRARQYDPTIGRFLSRDTWAYNIQNPFELNRYVYTANNPTTLTDPSGFSTTFFSWGFNSAEKAVIANVVLPVLTGVVIGIIVFVAGYLAVDKLLDVWGNSTTGEAIGTGTGTNVGEQTSTTVPGTRVPGADAPGVPTLADAPDGGVIVNQNPNPTPNNNDQPEPLPRPAPEPRFAPPGIGEPERGDDKECNRFNDSHVIMNWDRHPLMIIPEHMTPKDVIDLRSTLFGLPEFANGTLKANQPSVSRMKVECIATGMLFGLVPVSDQRPLLVAQMDRPSVRDVNTGDWVLTNGHTRYVASHLSGVVYANYAQVDSLGILYATSWEGVSFGAP